MAHPASIDSKIKIGQISIPCLLPGPSGAPVVKKTEIKSPPSSTVIGHQQFFKTMHH
jgi:hypothetical protein